MSEKESSSRDNNGDQDRSPQVGALLKASRLRIDEDLRDVSEILRIRYLYLEAIEECRYDDLPGDTYAIGFIRSYAEHLGIDGEEVARRFRAEQSGRKSPDALSFPTPVPESGMPKGAIVFVGVLLAMVIYGGWYVTTTDENALTDLISPVPERLKHLISDDEKADSKTADADASETAEEPTTDVPGSGDPMVPATDEAAAPAVTEQAQQTVRENTEEALAEAAAAAQDSISEQTEQAASEEVPTSPETESVLEGVEQAAGAAVSEAVTNVTDANEPPAQQVDEVVAETLTEGTSTESGQVAVADAPESNVAEPTVEVESTPSTAEEASTETEVTGETETESVASASGASASDDAVAEGTSSSAAPQSTVEDTSSSESAASQPVEDEVTADDLNAQALQAATGQTSNDGATAGSQPEAVTEAAGSNTQTESTSPSETGSRIVVRATESSWVQVSDSNSDEILFTGLLGPGETFNVPARAGLFLDTGNAGALDILVDGASVPKLGGVGTVRKGVVLDVGRLKAGTATN